MRIGELAQRSGVGIETIRFYETKGLLPEPLRLANNYRNYTNTHLSRLHFIRHCRLLGMSLEEVDKLVHLEKSRPEDLTLVHETVSAHIADIDKRIAELSELKAKLVALECRCSGDHAGHRCGILDQLEAYSDSCDKCRACCEFEHEASEAEKFK